MSSKRAYGWDAASEALLNSAAAHAAAFRRSLDNRLQRPEKTYAELREIFASCLPAKGCDGADVIEELVNKAVPGLGATAGPRFFGWVIGGSHPVGVAADWLTSAWGQNAAGIASSPAAAACEETAAGWLLELLNLPPECSVGFVTGATVANFTCLAAARGEVLRRIGWDAEARGLFGAPPIRVIIGDNAHASVFSALQYLGLGHDRVIRVASDPMGRMLLANFEKAIQAEEGPTIVVAQAGQINTGAFDAITEIVAIVHRHSAWVHVDGAFGLWARACAETAPLAIGYEAADSWAIDGHKWLQTPYDCGYAIVRNAEAHRRAMTITASYLPSTAEGERNPSHLVPELSRRARGFATWAMIRTLGREGIAQMIARHCNLARRMATRLAAEPGIAILNKVELNQIAVRFGADESVERGDVLTKKVIERIQAHGACFAGGAQCDGRWIMRLSIISWQTTEQDADVSVAAIIEAWRAVRAGS
jgi:glutamate/tyrosine decarboxylase-like PLP-dependent enzyme